MTAREPRPPEQYVIELIPEDQRLSDNCWVLRRDGDPLAFARTRAFAIEAAEYIIDLRLRRYQRTAELQVLSRDGSLFSSYHYE